MGKKKKGNASSSHGIVPPPAFDQWGNPVPVAISVEQKALQALADLGYTGLSIESLARLQPPDEFEDELIVMADVRAYFQVAYKVRYTAFYIRLCLTHKR